MNTTTRIIGGGFFECRSSDCVGVGSTEKEAYLNWYSTLMNLVLI